MRRLLALAAIVCAALVVFGVPGCGSKKSTQPKSPNQSTVPINTGTWEVTVAIDSSSGACGNVSASQTDTVFIDNGLDDIINDDCEYIVVGNHFAHGCTDTTYNDGSCVQISTLTGSGTFSGTSFTATFTITYVSTPPGCAPTPECVFYLTASGHRIGNAAQGGIRPMEPVLRGLMRTLRRR